MSNEFCGRIEDNRVAYMSSNLSNMLFNSKHIQVKVKRLNDIALRVHTSELRDGRWLRLIFIRAAIWDHTVLPATRHKWTRPA